MEAISKLEDGWRTFIVLASGERGADDAERGLITGADDYLLKPLSLPQLEAALNVAKARPRERDQFAPEPSGFRPSVREVIIRLGATVLITDPAGVITECSESITNLASGDLRGRTFGEIAEPPRGEAANMGAIPTSEQDELGWTIGTVPFEGKLGAIRRNGRVVGYLWSGRAA